ncbi:MAG: SDR family oxidoreductase [Thermoleophilaceae bacterium]
MARSDVRSLNGKVVAITGGARGIGLATARACAARGMKVAIGDLDLAEAERAAESIPGAVAIQLDVCERDSFERFLDAADAAHGPVDVLVNNAGIMQLGPFADEDDLTARRMVDINVHGVLHGMKLALARFAARGTGHLVNIASTAGKAGIPGGATYSGTKHFVVGVSEAVRAELRDTGIEVSVVMPAVVDTELAQGLQQSRGVRKVQPEEVAAEIVSALERPRFDVWVPRSVGPINLVVGALPRRAREAVGRAIGIDRVLASADSEARRAYELRAARSEPGLEPGNEARQLPRADADREPAERSHPRAGGQP